MMERELVEQIVHEVLSNMDLQAKAPAGAAAPTGGDNDLIDITSPEERSKPQVKNPYDPEALLRMMGKTTARIGVGRAGTRLTTRTQLILEADHALAQDSVFVDVGDKLLEHLGIPRFQTLCADRNQHLTRPDLGRSFSPETLDSIRSYAGTGAQVQIYLADGLSSRAIEANGENTLSALTKSLEGSGVKLGKPFFVNFGRVPAMDILSDTLGCEVICTLIGERPGLATPESMSAYIAYRATVNMPESRRTVVSNIHSKGISGVEAGAFIADVIRKMLEQHISGVELKL
jgi:ethanolamine ammonia-lyase small subunit